MAQLNDSASLVPITIFGPQGEMAFFPTGTLTSSFTPTEIINSIEETASYIIEFPTSSNSLQFRIPATSSGQDKDIIGFFFTSSGGDPRVGVGTKDPKATLDINSVTASVPPNILLRTNQDGDIEIGEETGKIIFAIESSSFGGTEIITSGSTAQIFSKVLGTSSLSNYGSLILGVSPSSDPNNIIEGITIGDGVNGNTGTVGTLITGSVEVKGGAPSYIVRGSNGNRVAYLGYNPATDFQDGQLILYYNGTQSVKINGDNDPAEASYIEYGNFGLGTDSPSHKLAVIGDISSSGTIFSDGYSVVSQSGVFVQNEFIIAATEYSVTSSDALAVSASNLGIGVANPEVRLHMLGETSQSAQILMEQFNNSADAPDIRTRRYRGTSASRADVQTGDYLFRLNVHGESGSASELYGSMRY